MLREPLDDIADRYTVSRDTDARTGHKTQDSSFFGFKTHIAMSEERIICFVCHANARGWGVRGTGNDTRYVAPCRVSCTINF